VVVGTFDIEEKRGNTGIVKSSDKRYRNWKGKRGP
jgi:hypothetical protein